VRSPCEWQHKPVETQVKIQIGIELLTKEEKQYWQGKIKKKPGQRIIEKF
jgi:hypothetical protein